MHPTLLDLGPVTIHSYGFMIALAFLMALFMCQRDGPRFQAPKEFVNSVAVGLLIAGVAGSRLLHILMFPASYSWSDPVGWIAIWRGGLVFQGAFPAAVLFAWFYARRKNVPVLGFADALGPYIPIGHALGRMGCFLNGCCYGRVTDISWAVEFPRIPANPEAQPTGSPAFLDHLRAGLVQFEDMTSLPVHPTQLYSVTGLLAMGAMMWMFREWWYPFRGVMICSYLALYGLLRFVLEFFRGDHNPVHFGGVLSDQQVFSLAFVAVGIALFVVLYVKERQRQNG